MKKSELKQLIREEVQKVLKESSTYTMDMVEDQFDNFMGDSLEDNTKRLAKKYIQAAFGRDSTISQSQYTNLCARFVKLIYDNLIY